MGNRPQAINFHNNGVAQQKAGGIDLSYQNFISAVYADQTFATGYAQLGGDSLSRQQYLAAIACCRRALELPDGPNPGDMFPDLRGKTLTNLAHCLHHSGQDDEAFKAVTEALKIDPKLSRAWMNKSIIEARWKQNKTAIQSARKAYNLEAAPVVEIALAFALLFDKQYAEGLKHFEARFPYQLQQFQNYPYPKWQGEENATLFLVSEQGMGDALSFSRFVERAAVRSKKIYMCVQPELKRLFSAMFLHQKNIEVIPMPCEFKPADYWTTFMSLPTAMGLTDEEIINAPSPTVPEFRAPQTWKAQDRKYHIGVAWAGSANNFINNHRSFPVTHLLELCAIPGVQLYSIQVGDRVSDLHSTGCVPVIADLSPYIRDMADTVGIINDLDLVVSVESAIPHLCGLMGKNVVVPYSWMGRDWRYGNTGESVLWNPTAKVYMQDDRATWGPVFNKIVKEMKDGLEAR